jgi:hypothetical protein
VAKWSGAACAAALAAASAGAQTVQINSVPAFPESSNGVTTEFQITPDSSRVLYGAELTTNDVTDLYSASVSAAGTQVQITTTSPAGDFFSGSFAITPNSATVIFGRFDGTNNHFDLKKASATAAGTESTLATNAGLNELSSILITSDGTRAVFQSRTNTDYGLFSASTATPGAVLKISSPFPELEYPRGLQLVDTASGTRALFTGELNADGVTELFSAPVNAANGQIALNSAPVTGGDVNNTNFAPVSSTASGASVIFSGDHVTDGVVNLYKASTTAAGTQTQLNTSFHADADVAGFLPAPLSNKVYYLGDLIDEGVYVVFEASTSGAPNQKAVYYPTPNYIGIRQISLTPDENYLVLRGTLTNSGITDLYTAPTTFDFAPRRVTQLASDQDVNSYIVSPDSTFIVYEQRGPTYTQNTLWAVSTTGAYAPVQIGPIPANQWITSYKITPDSSRVVYTAYKDGEFVLNLYSVAIPALNTVSNPIAAAPAAAIPGVTPSGPGSTPGSNAAPTLAVLGKKKVVTTGKPVKIKGTASDDRGVVSVLAIYKKVSASGKKKTVTKKAKLAGGAWIFKFRPKDKVTKLTFQSVDGDGVRSPIAKVKVLRQ